MKGLVFCPIDCKRNLRLRKVCPRCTIVHVKRAVCGCGHAFASKRKAQCTTNESVKRKRASESEKESVEREEEPG